MKKDSIGIKEYFFMLGFEPGTIRCYTSKWTTLPLDKQDYQFLKLHTLMSEIIFICTVRVSTSLSRYGEFHISHGSISHHNYMRVHSAKIK